MNELTILLSVAFSALVGYVVHRLGAVSQRDLERLREELNRLQTYSREDLAQLRKEHREDHRDVCLQLNEGRKP